MAWNPPWGLPNRHLNPIFSFQCSLRQTPIQLDKPLVLWYRDPVRQPSCQGFFVAAPSRACPERAKGRHSQLMICPFTSGRYEKRKRSERGSGERRHGGKHDETWGTHPKKGENAGGQSRQRPQIERTVIALGKTLSRRNAVKQWGRAETIWASCPRSRYATTSRPCSSTTGRHSSGSWRAKKRWLRPGASGDRKSYERAR